MSARSVAWSPRFPGVFLLSHHAVYLFHREAPATASGQAVALTLTLEHVYLQ